MVDIIKMYKTVLSQFSKDNNRNIDEEEFTEAVNIAQYDYYNEIIGRTNKKVNGQSLVSYGANQITDKRLDPFRVKENKIVTSGEIELQGEDKITSIVNSDTGIALKRLDEDRVGYINESPFREPNEDDIYYLEEGKGILSVFGVVENVTVRYLRLPSRAELKLKEVTITAGTRSVKRNVPDEDNSIDLEWNDTEYKPILDRVLNILSNPNREVFMTQKTNQSISNE